MNLAVYWQLEKGSKAERVYKNLEKQVDRVFKHCRQGSIKTRSRYSEGVKHLSKFLAESYNKQNLNNIENKHLEAYVEQMQDADYSTSYVTTNMSAIRFFVDQIKDSSYIKSNKELGVISRSKEERIGDNKAWTREQVREMQNIAHSKGFERVSDMIQLGYKQGLRVHEVTRLDRNDLKRALREDQLTVKGKGGLVRKVPLRGQEVRQTIQKLIDRTDVRQSKVFVREGEKTHEVIKQAQNFIANNRPVGENISFHGLRHTYSQERYQELRAEDKDHYQSRLELSHELGHFRVEITDIYLK